MGNERNTPQVKIILGRTADDCFCFALVAVVVVCVTPWSRGQSVRAFAAPWLADCALCSRCIPALCALGVSCFLDTATGYSCRVATAISRQVISHQSSVIGHRSKPHRVAHASNGSRNGECALYWCCTSMWLGGEGYYVVCTHLLIF